MNTTMTHSRACRPSVAQVDAAALALADEMFPRWTAASRLHASKDEASVVRVAARAALHAAVNAALQAESVTRSACAAHLAKPIETKSDQNFGFTVTGAPAVSVLLLSARTDKHRLADGFALGTPDGLVRSEGEEPEVRPRMVLDDLIEDAISRLPHASRLYPEVYAWKVSDAIAAALRSEG